MASNADAPKPGAQDPAMDDILASIRRILNEDDPPAPGGASPAAPGRPSDTDPAEAEPLELTESMLVQPASPPAAAAPPGSSGPAVPPPLLPAASPDAPPRQVAPPIAAVEPPEAQAMSAEALIAPAVAAATAGAMGKLLRAVVQERAATVSRGGPSIEDVVREELRPLLKEWLDRHLPPIVERLVRAEIERVVSREL